MSLRLPVGEMTALLGSGLARRRVMVALDESTASGSGGAAARVVRLTAAESESTAARCERVAGCGGATLVLADRVTDGLDAVGRRAVLVELRDLAATGVGVLVDDADPVATVAVADGVLRIDRGGGLTHERVGEVYLAS